MIAFLNTIDAIGKAISKVVRQVSIAYHRRRQWSASEILEREG